MFGKKLTFNILGSLLRNDGMKEPFRLYYDVKDGFVLIWDDKDLSNLFDEKLKGDKILVVYVDELNQSVGNEADNMGCGQGDVNEKEDVGVNNESGDFSGETEDLDFDIDDLDYEDGLDDKWFSENVDPDVEWFPNLESPKVHEGLECSESDEEEDVVKCDDALDSGKDSDDDGEHKFPTFNTVELYKPTFELGMIFNSKKKAIHSHAVSTNRNINITKNDRLRMHAKCADKDCGWKLHALNVPGELTFQINIPGHSCPGTFHVKNMRSKWIYGKFLKNFKSDPKRSVKGFMVDAIEKTRCHVSPYQAYAAKRNALDVIEGDSSEQYTLLWDFVEEVKRCNPRSTLVITTKEAENGDTTFDMLYMCLDALKKGFLSGCRPFLGLDGCHLKGPNEGVSLSAVGVDPNNNTFPLAIAVVGKEDKHTWEWFLTLLKVDLNISEDYKWTFMSDKQKGLIRAMEEVFPNATHRFCVRHLHENFKSAGFKGQDLKNALWKAARATTVNAFEKGMEEMIALNEKAFEWFENKPPQQWSKSYFNDIPRCDTLLNNGCETFNSCILVAREKPILSMLEWIFEYLMKRMQRNRDKCEEKWKGSFCPKIQEIIDNAIEKVGGCIPIKSHKYHYQIHCFDGSKYAVDIKEGTCGCREWDLSGIPCKHAMCALFNEGLDYYDFTHICYRRDTYKKVYALVIMPINGRNEWRPTGYIPPNPPNLGRDVGKPERARRRGKDEPAPKTKKRSRGKPKILSSEFRLKRQQRSLKCSECGGEGHNKKSCGHNSTQGIQTTIENDQSTIHEEIVVSQYRVSQSSEYGGTVGEGNNEVTPT